MDFDERPESAILVYKKERKRKELTETITLLH